MLKKFKRIRIGTMLCALFCLLAAPGQCWDHQLSIETNSMYYMQSLEQQSPAGTVGLRYTLHFSPDWGIGAGYLPVNFTSMLSGEEEKTGATFRETFGVDGKSIVVYLQRDLNLPKFMWDNVLSKARFQGGWMNLYFSDVDLQTTEHQDLVLLYYKYQPTSYTIRSFDTSVTIKSAYGGFIGTGFELYRIGDFSVDLDLLMTFLQFVIDYETRGEVVNNTTFAIEKLDKDEEKIINASFFSMKLGASYTFSWDTFGIGRTPVPVVPERTEAPPTTTAPATLEPASTPATPAPVQ